MGNAEFSLKGYQMFRKDREVRRGGGVALYIKQSIQAYEFQINNVVDYDDAIWCNILIRGAKLTVGVVYRCPSTSKEQDVILHNVISHVSRNDCLIMGDFKDVVTPYKHISEASRYILYTILLTFDGICTLS